MDDPELPEDLQAFLRDHIESYEQLEIVLLLQSRPHQSMESAAVAAELRLPESIVDEALDSLCQRRLLARTPDPVAPLFQYRPATSSLGELVSELARVNHERRLDVMRLMNANAIERLRTRALSTFADAFLVRRRKGKDD